MKIKVSEATEIQLDWLVAKLEYPSQMYDFHPMYYEGDFHYSSDWAQGGPIIERERISIERLPSAGIWWAKHPKNFGGLLRHSKSGPTPLIAAMRSFVASKLGDEVEVPNELS